jgi:hypothetical protein
MKSTNKLILALLFTLILASCEKELNTTNVNPNNPESVDPNYLLNSSIYKTLNLFGGDMRRTVFAHYSNYVSVGGGQLERYGNFPSSTNTYWQTAYTGCLQPVHQIEVNYGNNPAFKNRVAIAKIFECYIYSNLVAIWGSIPKTYALSGNVSIPYDKEENIYYDLLDELKSSADSISLTGGDTYTASADAMYAGSLINWKKFANTLRLRLAVRISNANAEKAKLVISDVLANEQNTIVSSMESAHAVWGTTSTTWSWLYNYDIVQAIVNASSLNVISESLVQHMLPYNDPRLAIYAKPASQGAYIGQYWGQPKASQLPIGFSMPNNPHTNLAPGDYSMIGDYFTKPDAEYVFLSYEESCFLKAEVALKGWGGSATAEQYYIQGVTASMQKYNVPQTTINTYLATPGIKLNTVVDTTGKGARYQDYLGITTSAILTLNPFRQLVMQEWLAGFYNASDAWNLIKRTQVLEFPPHFNPDGTSPTATWGYAYIPQRLVYPDIETQVNTTELNKALPWLNGPDVLITKLWFALPTKKNPYLIY